MVDYNSYQPDENPDCFSMLHNFSLRTAIMVLLSSSSCNSESIFNFFSVRPFSHPTLLKWVQTHPAAQGGRVQKLTKNLQEHKRVGSYCLHIKGKEEPSFCLLRILLPFYKEQKAHTENTHRKPNQLRKRRLLRQSSKQTPLETSKNKARNSTKPGKGMVLSFSLQIRVTEATTPANHIITQFLIRSAAQRFIKYLQVTFF